MRSLARLGIALLKYLDVWQAYSRYFWGHLLLALKLGFRGNMPTCFGDLVHFKANLKEMFTLLLSSLSMLSWAKAHS